MYLEWSLESFVRPSRIYTHIDSISPLFSLSLSLCALNT